MVNIQNSIKQNVTNGRGIVEYQPRAGDDTYLSLQARLGRMEGVGYVQIYVLEALDQTAKDLRLSDKVITPETVDQFLGIQQRYSSELISLGDDIKKLGISDEVKTLEDVEKLLKMKRYFTGGTSEDNPNAYLGPGYCSFELIGAIWSKNLIEPKEYYIINKKKDRLEPTIEEIRGRYTPSPISELIEPIEYFDRPRKPKFIKKYDVGEITLEKLLPRKIF